MNKDYQDWKNNFYSSKSTERLGQRFINDFIKLPWPELYYEEDTVKADAMIREWLTNNHHFCTMPQKINKV